MKIIVFTIVGDCQESMMDAQEKSYSNHKSSDDPAATPTSLMASTAQGEDPDGECEGFEEEPMEEDENVDAD